jgi:hypothetical protein
MAQRGRPRVSRAHDLIALVAVLSAGIVLIALGVRPEALGTVALALSGLYSLWSGQRGGRGPRPPSP